ncbi:kunitz trypsin inhibitor 2-like [Abrus precatorius]|uniref:Kunitz trypsin inhibitor 2-like n=1 Tax=Abrus precatorius TaxID=3816 RepID=A0A8B8LV52_ABRPR|nr:kunitz trypsin inhibitor 2-like [Abrus precatorius]
MKTTLLAFLLFLALTSQPLLEAAEPASEPVIDTSRKKLQTDANYYIIPAVPFTICGFVSCFTGGGLALDSDNESCPLDVVVEKANQGLPLRFTPINTKKGVINVSTDLNIRFYNADERCPHFSTVWKLDNFVASIGQTFVTTGGVLGNLGQHKILNWFKIETFDDAYKLVYCPSVCPSCNHVCKDVGIFEDGNKKMHLALSDIPFKVKFQRA